MEKIVVRINRKSIKDREKVKQQISRSQDRLLGLHSQQMAFYEKEQRIIEVGLLDADCAVPRGEVQAFAG